jgi:LytS/YehU family sensor histidine kinase
MVLTAPVLWLARRLPVVGPGWPTRAVVHVLAGTVAAMLVNAVPVLFTLSEAGGRVGEFYGIMLREQFVLHFSIYGVVLGAGHAMDFYRKFRERELTASQLETQLARAHLQALKMQLHPHFLFNTLHAVSVLIDEDPKAAAQMVTRLGDLLRLAIDSSSTQEVSLEEELEFLRLYLAIEEMRFHDRLAVQYEIKPETLGAGVPSFILQPLVENSIKHGVSERAGKGRICISSQRTNGRLVLSVEDGGADPAAAPVSTWADGVGLRNTRERLARMYGAEHQVECENVDAGVRVTVSIPYHAAAAANGPEPDDGS